MPPACYLLPTCYQLSASAFQHVSHITMDTSMESHLFAKDAKSNTVRGEHVRHILKDGMAALMKPSTGSPFFDLAWIRKLWLCTWIHLIPTEQEVLPLTYHSLRHSIQRTSQRPHWLWECLAGSWNSRSFSTTLRMCSWSMEALLGRVHPHQFASYIQNVGLVWPALNSSNFWHIHFIRPISGVVDLPSLSFSTMLGRFSRASHWKLQQLKAVLLLNCFISQMFQEDWCSQLCPTTRFWHWVSLI